MKKIVIDIKRGGDLSKKEIGSWDKIMKKTFNGAPLGKYLYKNKIFFIIKEDNKFVAVGMLIPIKIKYLNKNYSILGIGGITTIKRKKEYGRLLIASILSYLKNKNKTGLGFCSHKNIFFYNRVGLGIKKNLTKNRFYFKTKNEKEKERLQKFHKNDPNIIYFNSKDNFIKRILKTKSKVEIPHAW